MYLKISCVCFLIFLSLLSKADFIELDSNNDTSFIVKNELIFEDSTGLMDINAVANSNNNGNFYPSSKTHGMTKNKNYNYWLKLTIDNRTNQSLVLFRDVVFKDIKIFEEISPNNYVEIERLDEALSFGKLFKRFRFIFYTHHKNQTSVYYLQFKPFIEQFIGISISSVEDFYKLEVDQNFYFGFFFGITFIIIIYNLIIGIRTKEKLNFYYSMYVFSLSMYASVAWYLLPFDRKSQDWFLSSYTVPFSLITISLLLYTQAFFNTKYSSAKVHKILYVLILIKVFINIYVLVFGHNFLNSSLIDIVFIGYAFFIGIKYYKSGYKPSRFFLLGFFIILIGHISHNLTQASFYNSYLFQLITPQIENSLFYASILEILIFSLSLSDRYRNIKDQKIATQQMLVEQLQQNEILRLKVTKELEEKVEERTYQISIQAQEIERMNLILKSQNVQLTEEVKSITKDRVMVKSVGLDDFKSTYFNDEECFKFLAQLKWKDGYTCKKCQNTTYSEGPVYMSRRCNHCKYIETPTSHTIFHHLRFSIVKAFYIIFLIYSRKEITIDELSKLLELRAATCHAFKQKVHKVMISKKKSLKSDEGWSSIILD